MSVIAQNGDPLEVDLEDPTQSQATYIGAHQANPL
jgi:hypothetical protein